MDEIAIKPKCVWLHRTNDIVGFCFNHVPKYFESCQFVNQYSLDEFKHRFKLRDDGDRDIHLANDALVITICQLSGNKSIPMPVIVFPLCNHSLYQIKDAVKSICTIFTELNPNAHLINIGTDGDHYRRKLFNSMRLNSFNEFWESLKFFDTNFVLGFLTVCYDILHIVKRIRGRLISETNTTKLIKRNINRSLLLSIFPQMEDLFNPKDYQNVPFAVKLLQGLSKINELDDQNNLLKDVYTEIECLNEIIQPLLNIFVNPKINLVDQLSQLAYASHLLLFIYRQHKTEFLTFQLYCDIQSIIQDAFKNAEFFNNHDKNAKLILAFLGTDELELLFGSIRTQTHANVCDIVELLERLTIAIQIENVYNRHPNWRKASRISTTNTKDHSSWRSWTGELTTKDLNQAMIKLLWTSGKHKATDYLKNLGFDLSNIDNEKVTILNPFGVNNPYKHLESEPDDLEFEILGNNSPIIDEIETDFNVSDNIAQFSENKVKSTYVYNEKVIHKSNAVSSLINCNTKLSKVRETRVFKPNENIFEINEINTFVLNEKNIMLCDVLATLMINSIDKSPVLTLISIDKILLGDQVKYDIDPESLKDCKISGTILELDTIEINQIIWKNVYGKQVEAIEGSLCCQIKNSLNGTQIEFSLSELKLIIGYLSSVIGSNNKIVMPTHKMTFNDEALKRELSLKVSVNEASSEKFTCKICDNVILKKYSRSHIGNLFALIF